MRLGYLKVVTSIRHGLALLLALSTANLVSAEGPVVINEIMYHVKATEHKEDTAAEFVELYHSGTTPVSLEGWSFSSGVRFTFPATTMQPGEFLVVAADLEAFQARHPQVTKVVGPYRGRLSNSGEKVELQDADEETVDEVAYADTGRWAQRESVRMKGYDDWTWIAPHDGLGHSLSLISPKAKNEFGDSWRASEAEGGTPGIANDVLVEAIPPVVVSLEHSPAIPTSTTGVTVTATVAHGSATRLEVLFRQDGDEGFRTVPMTDGKAEIPAMSDKTVVHYCVRATDDQALVTHYPSLNGGSLEAERQALQLYQVDDDHSLKAEQAPGSKPIYRFITTADEIKMLKKLGGMSGRSNVYDNHLHGTFIVVDGVDVTVKHHVSARIRGHGSRSAFPPGLRVSFPSDDPWRGVTAINLNTQYTHSQALGAAIHQVAGVASSARSTPVHMRMNGEDWARKGSPQYGCYVHNEVLDSDYVSSHFPGQEDGNLYRLVGNAYLNESENNSNFRSEYNKRNHSADDDHSDVVRVTKTLKKTSPSDTYFDRVNEVLDLRQWARYIALDALLCNTEGGMSTGRGDDVAMFRPPDGRFQLLPYDLDSILGMGEAEQGIDKSVFDYGNMSGLRTIFKDPRFLQLYTRQFIELTDTVYRPEVIERVIDDLWQDWIPAKETEKVKTFLRKRIDIVLSQIRSNTVIGTTLEKEKGFYRASSTKFALYGRYDRSVVQQVTVGGQTPKLFAETGTWIMAPDRLVDLVRPGMNQIPVIMRDLEGNVIDQELMRVWLDNGRVRRVSGPLPATEPIVTWKAEEGPFLLEGEVIVPPETTLVIEGGTTVYGGATGVLAVAGKLIVQGSGDKRITFAQDPSDESSEGWGGIRVSGEATISYADMLDLNGPVHVVDGTWQMSNSQLQWVADHGLSVEKGTIELSDTSLHQAGQGTQPLLEASGADVSLIRNTWNRAGTQAALKVIAAESSYVFGNVFEQSGTPVVQADVGYIDGNDFSVRSSGTEPIILTKPDVLLTRNRRFGPAQLSDPVVTGLGNEWSDQQKPRRSIAAADVRITKQVPPKVSSTSLTFGIEGHALSAIRYRVDEGAWSDPIEIQKSPHQLTVDVEPGEHTLALVGRHDSGRWLAESEATVSRPFEVVPGLPSVVISEVLAINEGAYRHRGDLTDYIELHNVGDDAFDLSGFALSDDPENLREHVFPQGTTLGPDSYQVYAANKDALGFALAGDGDQVILSDPRGNIIDRVHFGLQLEDHSISRLEDGEWVLSEPTPKKPNVAIELGEPSQLTFTEWYAVPNLSSPDEFVELTNPGERPVNLGEFVITDRIASPVAWRPLPPLSFMAAQSRRVFYTNGETKKGATNLDFSLSNAGEVFGLLDPLGLLVDHVVFGPQTAGVSQGRGGSGGLIFHPPSPGRASAEPRDAVGAELAEAVRISEIHYHPSAEADEEFIELINIGESAVQLEGVAFTGGIDFVFGTRELAPGACAVIVKDRASFRKRYGTEIPIAGEYDGKLSNGGERLTLATPSDQAILEFDYSDKWHRSTDGRGYSLTIVDPRATRLDSRRAWKPSDELGGTPGK